VSVAIEVSGLEKSYATGWLGRQERALRGIDLQVECGETLAILGPNGAGKSTLLLVLAGLRHPTAGRWKVRGSVGLVPERPALYPGLSARRLLWLCGSAQGMAESELGTRVEEELERLRLLPFADRPIRALSQGVRQRVALAQALLHKPDVLLLDEPLGALDPQSALALVDVLNAEKARGATLVVATHRLAELAGTCGEVAYMRDGALWALGPTGSVLQRLPSRITYGMADGTAGTVSVAQVVADPDGQEAAMAALRARGGRVIRVEPDVTAMGGLSSDGSVPRP